MRSCLFIDKLRIRRVVSTKLHIILYIGLKIQEFLILFVYLFCVYEIKLTLLLLFVFCQLKYETYA